MKVFVTSDIHGRFDVLDKVIMFVKERDDIVPYCDKSKFNNFVAIEYVNFSMYGVNRGSSAIRDMIVEKKPAFFFCGHVHDAFGYNN